MEKLRRRYREDDKARQMKDRADNLGIEMTLQEAACVANSDGSVKTDMLDGDSIVKDIDTKLLARLLFPRKETSKC